ncbi:MAG: hypothetical protein RR597_07520 [Christensenella sp.]
MDLKKSNDEIGRKMYACEYTWGELQFKLSGKKRCLKCGGKMIPFHKEHYAGTDYFNAMTAGGGAADKYIREAWYRCKECNAEYSLRELMEHADKEEREKRKSGK